MKRIGPNNIIDHILKFDPEDPKTAMIESSPQPVALSTARLPVIPWPGSKPAPAPLRKKPAANSALPAADVLVVTWTVAEALALSDVLTPGYRSKTAWYQYGHNWNSVFKPMLKKGAPALEEGCMGLWFPVNIGGKSVICMKSHLHLDRDGAKMPIVKFWQQVIAETDPQLVITTGTAGGIGKSMILGDVVVSQKVRFDCTTIFKNQPFAQQQFTCAQNVPTGGIAKANSKLMGLVKDQLPAATRSPKIITSPLSSGMKIDVVTTDFFAYDDTTNSFGLQSMGSAVEMGDAVLGMVCSQLGSKAPPWVAIRNASDPQINGNLTTAEQVAMAGRIYEKYGYWTTVNSAMACWAVITS